MNFEPIRDFFYDSKQVKYKNVQGQTNTIFQARFLFSKAIFFSNKCLRILTQQISLGLNPLLFVIRPCAFELSHST